MIYLLFIYPSQNEHPLSNRIYPVLIFSIFCNLELKKPGLFNSSLTDK